MSDSNQKPVLFLAYANDRLDGDRYLRDVVEEVHAIRDLLLEKASGAYEVVVRDNASLDDLFDVFDRYGSRIRVFHFAGHANNLQLMLDQSRGQSSRAGREGFTREIAALPNLQLVFLNACTTRTHAIEMAAAEVPAVIATATDISDRAAYLFSSYFYEQLADRRSIGEAFDIAERRVQTALVSGGSFRKLYWGKPEADDQTFTQFPWGVYGQNLQWRFRLKKTILSSSLWPLMVDRDRQVIDFRDALESILGDPDHQPHAFIIQGTRPERPQSLITRFVETDIQELSSQIFGTNRGVVHEHQVRTWPYSGSLEQRQRELKRRLAEALNFQGRGVSQNWSANEVVEALRLRARTVVLQHTITTEKWDSTTLKLLGWYVSDFWRINSAREFPQFLIFINLLFPEEKIRWWNRILPSSNTKDGIKAGMEKLSLDLAHQLTILSELKPIRYEDVVSWVDDYFPEQLQDLPDILFKNRENRLSMEVVEPALERALLGLSSGNPEPRSAPQDEPS